MNSYPIGDTVTLSENFSVAGTLTDPTTISLVVQSPTGAQTTYTYAGAQITRIGTGQYSINIAVSTTGVWAYKWVGTGTAPAVGEAQFEVYDLLSGDSVATPSLNLVSVNQYKQAFGMDSADTSQDANIRLWISAASAAIATYTRREFINTSGDGLTRNFEVRSTGYVPFGRWDLQSIDSNGVSIDTESGDDTTTPTVINSDQYLLLPVASPDGVYTALKFYTFAVGPILRQVYGISRQVSITGLWGWPSVPLDVQRACLLCTRDWLVGFGQSFSETLATHMQDEITSSRSQGNIPLPARILLDPYRKVLV